MALQSANFVDAVVTDLLMSDFRNSNELLNVLTDSATSRAVEQMAIRAGGQGGFAKKLTLPLLKQAALSPTDGYTTVSAFPSANSNPDLSSAYSIPTDESILFNINHHAIGTHKLPDLERWTHAAGDLIQDAKVQADIQEIRDQIESAVISDMDSSTVFASVASGAGQKFPLVTTSQAALLGDLKDLLGELNRQNAPRDDRWLVLHSTEEGIPVEYDGLASRDFPGIGDRRDGRFDRVAGFNILYTNNLTTSQALAFTSQSYALVMPVGLRVESLRDKDELGDFTRVWTVFGMGAVKEIVAAADGNSPTFNAQRAGIVSVSVS